MKIDEISENVSGSFATSMGSGNGFLNGGTGIIKRIKKKAKKKVKESVYKMNKEDPNNPEVLIQGYGRLNMDQLKRMCTQMLEGLAQFADQDNWERVQYELDRGTFKPKLDALISALEDLEQIRKKGGANSRGINKR